MTGRLEVRGFKDVGYVSVIYFGLTVLPIRTLACRSILTPIFTNNRIEMTIFILVVNLKKTWIPEI